MSRSVELARLWKGRATALFRLYSTLWELRTHWVGRTLPCLGQESCPLCSTNRAKTRLYAFGRIKLAHVAQAEAYLIELHRHPQWELQPGDVIEMNAADRSISMLASERLTPEPACEVALAVSLDCLFSLPEAQWDWQHGDVPTPAEWLARQDLPIRAALCRMGGEAWRN